MQKGIGRGVFVAIIFAVLLISVLAVSVSAASDSETGIFWKWLKNFFGGKPKVTGQIIGSPCVTSSNCGYSEVCIAGVCQSSGGGGGPDCQPGGFCYGYPCNTGQSQYCEGACCGGGGSIGACCGGSLGYCSIVPQSACFGVWQGAGTSCNPNPCPACGNGICESLKGESNVNCPQDCPICYGTDNDGDGYSTSADDEGRMCCNGITTKVNCLSGIDCDDNSYKRNPGATEVCDAIDNDCNNVIDDNFNVGSSCTADSIDGQMVCSEDSSTSVCMPGILADYTVSSACSQVASTNPRYITEYNGQLYFDATGYFTGDELYTYSPGSGITLVQDKYPGPFGTGPADLAVYNGNLYFRENVPPTGVGLYVYDGSTISLILGSEGLTPSFMFVYNNKLYFEGLTGSVYKFYVYDGLTISQVPMPSGVSFSSGSSGPFFTAFNNKLYFVAEDSTYGKELYVFDGSTVSLVEDLYPGTGGSSPFYLTVYNGKLYFQATSTQGQVAKLVAYDPVADTFSEITTTASSFGFYNRMSVYNGKLYFGSYLPAYGIYSYDSSNGNISLITDKFNMGDFAWYNGRMYYNGKNALLDYELYSYDPATGANALVRDICYRGGAYDRCGGSPDSFIVFDGKLYFVASNYKKNVFETCSSDELYSYSRPASQGPDTTPPVSTFAVTSPSAEPNGDNGWYKNDVQYSITAEDPGNPSGSVYLYVCTDKTPTTPCTPQGPVPVPYQGTIDTQGTTYVRYYTVDGASPPNQENNGVPKVVTIKIDKTAPNIVNSAPEDHSYLKVKSVTVSGTVTDNLMLFPFIKINGKDIALDGSYDNSKTFSATVELNEGDNYIYETAKDDAGNSAENTKYVTVDTEKPISIFSTAPDLNAAGWANTNVLYTIIGTDFGSGIKNISVCVDEADSCSPVVVESNPVPGMDYARQYGKYLTTEGIYHVRYYVEDKAGNTDVDSTSPNSQTVKIDKTKPTTTFTITSPSDGPDGQNGWYVHDVYFSLNANDGSGTGSSGVKAVYYCVDQSNTCVLNNEASILPFTDSITTEGINYARYRAGDNAGNNESSTSFLVYIDKTPPVLQFTTFPAQPNGQGQWAGWFVPAQTFGYVSYTIYATEGDDRSGLKAIYACDEMVDGVGCTPTEKSTTSPYEEVIRTEGAHTIRYYSEDNAGNKNDIQEQIIKYHRAIPTSTLQLSPENPNGENNWYKTDVGFTITASGEDPAGDYYVYVCTDTVNPDSIQTPCTPERKYTAAYTGTISTESEFNNIRYYAADNFDSKENDGVPKVQTIKLDKTPPTITNSAPDSPSATKNSPVTVTGSVQDNLGEGTISNPFIRLTINGENVALGVGGMVYQFSKDVAIVEGDNFIKEIAKDRAGNEVTKTKKVTLDTKAPTIECPPDRNLISQSVSYTLTGTASDGDRTDIQYPKVYELLLGNAQVSGYPVKTWTLAVNVGRDTMTLYHMFAKDEAGNEGSCETSVNHCSDGDGDGAPDPM